MSLSPQSTGDPLKRSFSVDLRRLSDSIIMEYLQRAHVAQLSNEFSIKLKAITDIVIVFCERAGRPVESNLLMGCVRADRALSCEFYDKSCRHVCECYRAGHNALMMKGNFKCNQNENNRYDVRG